MGERAITGNPEDLDDTPTLQDRIAELLREWGKLGLKPSHIHVGAREWAEIEVKVWDPERGVPTGKGRPTCFGIPVYRVDDESFLGVT